MHAESDMNAKIKTIKAEYSWYTIDRLVASEIVAMPLFYLNIVYNVRRFSVLPVSPGWLTKFFILPQKISHHFVNPIISPEK